VFQVTEAYRIDNGKLGAPLKGAMLIGNGPTDLKRISMVGNDLKLDTGVGTCGKNGQGVPVGVGPADAAPGSHHGRRNRLRHGAFVLVLIFRICLPRLCALRMRIAFVG
jgi:hypothetical protein